jgi:hypothetical protein
MTATTRAAHVRANMRQAVEASGMSLEALSEVTEIPLGELRDKVLDGDDSGKGLLVEDMHRVAVAIGATDTFADWFGEPQVVATS